MDLLPAEYLRKYLAVYPQAKGQADDFRAAQGSGMEAWPSWCYLPLSGAYAIASTEAERQGVDEKLMASDIGNLGALLAWRQTQGVYRFDETLFRALWDTDLSGDIPTETLYQIPEWCVWIETPNAPGAVPSRGFFAYLEYDYSTQLSELRFAIDSTESHQPPGALIQQILHLNKPTIAEALAAGYEQGARLANERGEKIPFTSEQALEAGKILREVAAPRLSLLLYLCTVNSEIRDAKGSTKAPANPQPVKIRSGTKLFAAATPTKWDVGFRIGAALQHAQEQAQAEERVTTGAGHASPRPHIRRAHWHTYKTGAGRSNEVLKWLPPIPVNVELPEDLIPTIRPVR